MSGIFPNGIAFISSRYRGATVESEQEHARIAAAMCLFAMQHGYTPYASHLLCTQFLDDERASHRTFGIAAGHDVLPQCSRVFVYGPHTHVSSGVRDDLVAAGEHNIEVQEVTWEDLQACLAEIRPSRLYSRIFSEQ